MIATVKSWLRWVYDWITILAALLVGLPEILLYVLQTFDGIDPAPLIGPELSLKIVTSVAILKAVLALIEAAVKAKRA